MTAIITFPPLPYQFELVGRSHPLRSQVEAYVTKRYEHAFNAQLNQFMPEYLLLREGELIKSVCGIRSAEQESLFLEQYLPASAETLITEHFGCAIHRASIIEFGQLASFSHGLSALHFLMMTDTLVEQGFEWCIFTATDPLHAMLSRLGLSPKVLAQADAKYVTDANKIWGSYYQHQPRILAGNLKQGLKQLSSLYQQRRARSGGE